ncbi:uncharacterized protein LOC111129378 isoform X2 [Crassostrea virginica]
MDSISWNVESGIQTLCESVFVRLCQIVGTSKQVAIRRDSRAIRELLDKRVLENDEAVNMESGSAGEGFRLSGSDVDYMYWPNGYRVIWDILQSWSIYRNNKQRITFRYL